MPSPKPGRAANDAREKAKKNCANRKLFRSRRNRRRLSHNAFYFKLRALYKLSSLRSKLDLQLLTDRMDGMKIQTSLRIILAGVSFVLLQACVTTPRSGSAALVGTWTNSLGTVWTIRTDGTFDVDRNHDGKRDIWGTYTVAGDTITIQETGRTTPIPRDCKGPGVYKFSRPSKNTLMLTLVNDACGLRKKNVLLAQHQK